jgi:hypothetical protein
MATSPHAAHPQGYEKTDASPRGLLYFALVMAAILAATSVSLMWLFKYFQKAENPGSVIAAPFAAERPVPSPPRIQSNPDADMRSYWQSQQNLLNTYGWIDRQNDIVRIPIDRAMEILLERGLPTRSTSTPEAGASLQKGNGSANGATSRGSAR